METTFQSQNVGDCRSNNVLVIDDEDSKWAGRVQGLPLLLKSRLGSPVGCPMRDICGWVGWREREKVLIPNSMIKFEVSSISGVVSHAGRSSLPQSVPDSSPARLDSVN